MLRKEETFIKLNTCSIVCLVVLGSIVYLSIHLGDQQLQQALATSIKTKVNLAIEGLSVGESPTGLIAVNGTVYNNSTINLINVEVRAELNNANNELIRETIRYVTPPTSVFQPGDMQPFRFLIIAEDVDHYNVTAYGIK
ncbi:MAG: FxLYD domain-containing protein [Nitrososphaeraceae archaeon]